MSTITALADHCRDHAGVATLACARAVELPDGRFRRMVASQEWARVGSRGWRLPGAPEDPAAPAIAACLAVGGEVAVTGRSALALLDDGFDTPDTVDLLLPAGRRKPTLEGVRVRRTRLWDQVVTTTRAGVPVTSLAWTLGILGEQLGDRTRRAKALHGELHDLLRVDDVHQVAAALRRGASARAMRRLASELASDGSESGFEFDARTRLAEAGLHPVAEQLEVRTSGRRRRLDIPFLPEHVVVECVGRTYRSTPSQFEAHVQRRNEVAELDRWLVLELTWQRFHDDWDGFVHQLRRCLDARRT